MTNHENAGDPPLRPADLGPGGVAPRSATKRVCLIDLSGIFRANWHATEHEEIGEAFRRTLSAVNGFAAGYDAVGICVDRPPYKRLEIDPQYKAQREKAPDALHEQLRAVEQRLDDDGHRIFGAKGFEADDVIATLADWAHAKGFEVTVYSADKDVLQLVRDGVAVISTATRQKYTTREVADKFGVRPGLISDLLALIGDGSDNIPGIKGVGPKTAAPWLNEHGGLEGVLLNAEKLEPARFREVVAGSKELLGRSWRLTQLSRDVPVKPEELMEPKEAKQSEPPETEPEVLEEEQATTAIAKVEARQIVEGVSWERALEPIGVEGAWKLAHHLYKSRMFGNWPNAEAILGVVMTGRSFGLDAVTSLRNFHNIQGKASPSAQMMIGLVKRHPVCEWFRLVETTSEKAAWETKRRDEPQPTRLVYTIDEARAAGLLGNDNWKKRPATMLRWRAGVELARVVYPDVVSGLYTPDELEEAA